MKAKYLQNNNPKVLSNIKTRHKHFSTFCKKKKTSYNFSATTYQPYQFCTLKPKQGIALIAANQKRKPSCCRISYVSPDVLCPAPPWHWWAENMDSYIAYWTLSSSSSESTSTSLAYFRVTPICFNILSIDPFSGCWAEVVSSTQSVSPYCRAGCSFILRISSWRMVIAPFYYVNTFLQVISLNYFS